MSLRIIKILLVLSLGLTCLFYALQNIANIGPAYEVVFYVLSLQGHEYYPQTFAFGVTSSALVWVALIVIILLELLAGALLIWGAWKMFSVRKASSGEFQSAKYLPMVGAGVGVLVWFGLFQGLGSSFFQMWQTDVGSGSHRDAFTLAASLVLIMLFVNQPESD